MDINFQCPSCKQQLSVPEQYAGQQGTCPGCGAALTVPPASIASPPPIVAPLPSEDATLRPAAPQPGPSYGPAPQPQPYGYSALPHEAGRPAYGPVPPGVQVHPLAIASLVMGIASFVVCPFVLTIPGLVCGIMARNRIRAMPAIYSGDGLALAGIIVSAINLGLTVLGGIFYVVAIAVATAHGP
ncbi:MAG: DUF4190 domain-containing protein [Planctomycetes bacterium]|nr:DUF4190 domain-containing protein [Planctomycetota bacterium]